MAKIDAAQLLGGDPVHLEIAGRVCSINQGPPLSAVEGGAEYVYKKHIM